jgi:HEAT repeats
VPIEDPKYRAAAIACICAALQDPIPAVRCTAVEALGKLGLEEYILPLVEIYADEDADVRRTVIKTLGRMGEQRRMSGDQTFNIDRVGNLNADDVTIQGDQIGDQNNPKPTKF